MQSIKSNQIHTRASGTPERRPQPKSSLASHCILASVKGCLLVITSISQVCQPFIELVDALPRGMEERALAQLSEQQVGGHRGKQKCQLFPNPKMREECLRQPCPVCCHQPGGPTNPYLATSGGFAWHTGIIKTHQQPHRHITPKIAIPAPKLFPSTHRLLCRPEMHASAVNACPCINAKSQICVLLHPIQLCTATPLCVGPRYTSRSHRYLCFLWADQYAKLYDNLLNSIHELLHTGRGGGQQATSFAYPKSSTQVPQRSRKCLCKPSE